VFTICAMSAFSQVPVTINDAIEGAVRNIANGVPLNSQIAVINIEAESPNLSDHIINGIMTGLVNARAFRVVPRGTIELGAASAEFMFQMDGHVSEAAQRRMGEFLAADTIVTGTVTIAAGGAYRLTVNAINLEGFFLLASYSATFSADQQVRTIIEGVDVAELERRQAAIVAERERRQWENERRRRERAEVSRVRAQMGAMNMAFGLGAFRLRYGHSRGGNPPHAALGYVLVGGQALGIGIVIPGLIFTFVDSMADEGDEFGGRNILITGGIVYGAFALIGWIAPIFIINRDNHRDVRFSDTGGSVPFDLELASTNGRDINGLRITHTLRF